MTKFRNEFNLEIGNMNNLKNLKCENHQEREAAVRCPGCYLFFCRECATEHNGRLLCLGCLKNNLATSDGIVKRSGILVLTVIFIASLFASWYFFYIIGIALASIPQDYHNGTAIEKAVGIDGTK